MLHTKAMLCVPAMDKMIEGKWVFQCTPCLFCCNKIAHFIEKMYICSTI